MFAKRNTFRDAPVLKRNCALCGLGTDHSTDGEAVSRAMLSSADRDLKKLK